MEIKSLDEGIIEKEPINSPIHISFTRLEWHRWKMIQRRLKTAKPNAKIGEFARIALRDLMDRLEQLLDKHESK